jgi:uncharacterized protein (DUF924 family)
MSDHEEIVAYWLGDLDEQGLASAENVKKWWTKSAALDAEIRERFGGDHAAIMADEREAWLDSARSRLAYILVLDQFSRNMFRDTAEMYAGDERGLRAVKDGFERGHDVELQIHERVFMYMPLMHSEALADQDLCVEKFEALSASLDGDAFERIDKNRHYAVVHRDIVAEWGRFPHRNAIVGRDTTPEEAAFLKKPGSSF